MDTAVPQKDHGPTARLQKTCTGALLQAGPELLQSHYGFGKRKRQSFSEALTSHPPTVPSHMHPPPSSHIHSPSNTKTHMPLLTITQTTSPQQ